MDSGEARTLSTQLEQKLQQIRNLMRDAVVEQFAEVFVDVESFSQQLADGVALPAGPLLMHFKKYSTRYQSTHPSVYGYRVTKPRRKVGGMFEELSRK